MRVTYRPKEHGLEAGNQRPGVGLALGGGGLRGAAHIGVLEVLIEAGIPIDFIGGTSAGSIVAALHACGWTPQRMATAARSLTMRDVFDPYWGPAVIVAMGLKVVFDFLRLPSPWPRPPLGLIRGRRWERLLDRWTEGRDFQSLRLPTAIVATDLNAGHRVVFATEPVPVATRQLRRTRVSQAVSVAAAVRASTAIPGIFEPKDVNGLTLVDGGLVDNVPADVVRAMGAGIVIAVPLGFAGQNKRSVDNVLELALQSIDIMGEAITRANVSGRADVVINPAIYDVGLTEWERIPECIERGRQAARRALPSILARLQQTGRQNAL